MIKWFLLSLLVLASLSNFSDAGINDVSNSICRIQTDTSCMTGWCYKEDDEYYYFISAGHFKDGLENKKITVSAFHDGAMQSFKAEKVFEVYEEGQPNDLSVVKLKKDELGDYTKFEPLVLAEISNGSHTIWSYGCSDGNWPTAFKGVYIGKFKERRRLFTFKPAVIQGRSGSPVLNEDGTEVIGMILMCHTTSINEQEFREYGIAVTVEHIRSMLKENNLEVK